MLGKSIAGVNLVEFLHDTVSGDLGYDRSTGNGQTQFVTSSYPSLRDSTLRQGYPVDNQEVRLLGQFFHRLHHSELGGLKDIDRVNHFRGNDANADSQSFLVNQIEQGFPFLGI